MSRARMHGGLLLAALAIALIAAACFPTAPPPPPPPPGQLSANPTTLDYGTNPLNQLQGANMPNKTVTVTNTGGQAVRLVSETSSNGIYSMPMNTCGGSTLAPGQSCSVTMQFCPSSASPTPVTGTLTVTGMSGATPVSAMAGLTGVANP